MKNILSTCALLAFIPVTAQSGGTIPTTASSTASLQVVSAVADAGQSFELVSFIAEPAGDAGVDLHWTTASEGKDMRFLVERSADRMNWKNAITTDAEGVSQGYTNYEVRDLEPMRGISYYRLVAMEGVKQLDVSDDFPVEYSPSPTLSFRNAREHGQFTVEGKGTLTDVQVLNDRGQFLPMALDYQGDHVLVNAEQLEPGTYFVQAQVDGTPVLRTVIVTANGVLGG